MRNRFAIVVGICLLALPGCMYHGNYPNGYYGGGPSVLPAQPWTGYPNGPVYQPGGPIYQPGTPTYQPGSGYPTPINPGTVPGGQPSDANPQTYGTGSGNNSAPNFDPSTPGSGVPMPNDDGTDSNRGSNRNTGITPTSSATSPRDNKDLETPFGPGTRTQRRSEIESTAQADDLFVNPSVRQASGNSDDASDVMQAGDQVPASRVSSKRFARDSRFAWVQGTVEYDELNQNWVIMYDDNPPTSDPYGGELAISNDLSNQGLRQGDIVRFEGTIDKLNKDSRGKPKYDAKSLDILATQ